MQDTASTTAADTVREFNLPFGIQIHAYPEGGGTIRSGLTHELGKSVRAKASSDALEALLLAMAGQGIDVGSAQMQAAVTTAVDAIANHLD
jgi:hypothetical protein